MSEQNIMVQVSNLALTYQSAEGEIEAIRDLSFSVADGEFVSVIGPSGCGKSTLLSIIAGLLSPTAGEIRLAGDGSIGYMLQKDSLFPWRTIRRNVLLGAEIKGGGLRAAEEYADSLLKTYGLWEFRDCFPGQLSGGMRQRAAFGRTALTGSSAPSRCARSFCFSTRRFRRSTTRPGWQWRTISTRSSAGRVKPR